MKFYQLLCNKENNGVNENIYLKSFKQVSYEFTENENLKKLFNEH